MNNEHFKMKKIINYATSLQDVHTQFTEYLQKTHEI